MPKKIRFFMKQMKAKQHILNVIIATLMILLVMFSSMIVLVPTVSADEGTVSTIGYMPYGFRDGALIWYNNSIFSISGYNVTAAAVESKVHRYFPDAVGGYSANTTIYVGDITAGRYTFAWVLDETGVHVSEPCVWIIAGSDPAFAATQTIYGFGLENYTAWNTGDTLLETTAGLNIGWIDSGTGIIYCIGGVSGANYRDSVYAYQRQNGTSWKIHTLIDDINHYAGAYDADSSEYYMIGGKHGNAKTAEINVYCFSNNSDWVMDTLYENSFNWNACWDNQTDNVYAVCNYSTIPKTTILKINCSTHKFAGAINNVSIASLNKEVVWGHNDSNYLVYLFGGEDASAKHVNRVEILDLDLSYAPAAPNPSVYSLNGLSNGVFTYNGTAGSIVWSNSSGTAYETAEINMSINSTQNVTDIKVNLTFLNDTGPSIGVSNIGLEFSSDNITWSGNVIMVTTSNITINSSQWANNWCNGVNPFSGAGLTDKTASIWIRCRFSLPAGQDMDWYYCPVTINKIYICNIS